MSDLKSCPFCGADPDEVELAEDNIGKWQCFFVKCGHCGARGSSYCAEESAKQDAIDTWNKTAKIVEDTYSERR